MVGESDLNGQGDRTREIFFQLWGNDLSFVPCPWAYQMATFLASTPSYCTCQMAIARVVSAMVSEAIVHVLGRYQTVENRRVYRVEDLVSGAYRMLPSLENAWIYPRGECQTASVLVSVFEAGLGILQGASCQASRMMLIHDPISMGSAMPPFSTFYGFVVEMGSEFYDVCSVEAIVGGCFVLACRSLVCPGAPFLYCVLAPLPSNLATVISIVVDAPGFGREVAHPVWKLSIW